MTFSLVIFHFTMLITKTNIAELLIFANLMNIYFTCQMTPNQLLWSQMLVLRTTSLCSFHISIHLLIPSRKPSVMQSISHLLKQNYLLLDVALIRPFKFLTLIILLSLWMPYMQHIVFLIHWSIPINFKQ